MEKKKLTKLVLHKEPIANLNDMNMSQLKGGATPTITTITTSSNLCLAILSIAAGAYSIAGEDRSWLPHYCPEAPPQTDIYNSQVFVYGGCLISPVVVTP